MGDGGVAVIVTLSTGASCLTITISLGEYYVTCLFLHKNEYDILLGYWSAGGETRRTSGTVNSNMAASEI